jgi:hypothetical protein
MIPRSDSFDADRHALADRAIFDGLHLGRGCLLVAVAPTCSKSRHQKRRPLRSINLCRREKTAQLAALTARAAIIYSKQNNDGSIGDPNGHDDDDNIDVTMDVLGIPGSEVIINVDIGIRSTMRSIPNVVNVCIRPEGANKSCNVGPNVDRQRYFKAILLIFPATKRSFVGHLNPRRGKMWTYTTTFFRPAAPIGSSGSQYPPFRRPCATRK